MSGHIPPMPELAGETAEMKVVLLHAHARALASRLEAAEAAIEALNPGEDDPLTVARRLKRERVELGTAINRLAQALGWPPIAPDRPFADQIVDSALGRIALAGELAEALSWCAGFCGNTYAGDKGRAALAKFHSSHSSESTPKP